MCGGGGGDGGASELRAQEEARQARIRAATNQVNSTFSGFNDDLYSKVASDYSNYYTPEADKQYTDTLGRVRAQLSQRGLLDSTEGARQLGDLASFYEQTKGDIGNQARDFANQYRSSIEDARGGLLALAQGAPEIGAIANQASARANALTAPPAFSPVGDLFARFINQDARSVAAGNQPGQTVRSAADAFGAFRKQAANKLSYVVK